MSQSSKILILYSSQPKNKVGSDWQILEQKLPNLIKQNATVKCAGLNDFVYLASEQPAIFHLDEGYDMADFDLVIFRIVGKNLDLASSAANYLSYKGVKFTDSYLLSPVESKLANAFKNRLNNLPVIKTLYSTPNKIIESLQQADLKFPLILKDDKGRKGRFNYLVSNIDSAKEALIQAKANNIRLIAQEFIENEGDLRILIFNNKPRLAFLRKSSSGSHLNNTSQGGSATLVDLASLPKSMLQTAVRAAQIEELEVAGVDIVQDKKTGSHYIIEVNRAPQLARGVLVDEKLQAYAEFIDEITRKHS